MTHRDPAAFVPLKPNWFHILLTIADGDRHGYGIMQEVAERTGGKIRLWPATLYGSIRRMEPVEVDAADDGDDERRQYFGITRFGRGVLNAEVNRLEELVRLARAKGAVRS
jgi:DNA-binding PadR family transcriptional regulator